MNSPDIRSISILNAVFGKGVVLIEPVNIYGCILGDNVFVGPFVEIQRGVKIGNGTRIQSHSFICELVTIGENCTIAHGVMFINDPYRIGRPAQGDRSQWLPTTLGSRVTVGSNATILPVTICDDVVIGAGSVVTRNITSPGIYAGSPARLLRKIDNTIEKV
ncbi:UDP-3-O-(3-hydroxymyristoyl)glucosamine N-acyltransferase [Cylindrospermopsis raciborskii CENA303]|uniref:UDP-3-O-(3-hydroxymyristoyl)glucosamine N-acyltransferase n=1 Tax=Cylindrospermopsis raciborskii CENA303 TaxID=1170769 RepID=A0A1X4GIX3_9CYAN|nr:acyltransferase [Cylindrospermopsis raciborskii]OSO97114.1 UDP-3-O-(3-hydroxymyristoyl)glucosamine N-acyltransferase [Cylindrospermopsis raciborskii CENA303]